MYRTRIQTYKCSVVDKYIVVAKDAKAKTLEVVWFQKFGLPLQSSFSSFPCSFHHKLTMLMVNIADRSLGALRALTSSWRPFGPLDFALRALRALRPVTHATVIG